MVRYLKATGKETGQIIVLSAFLLPVILGFVGMAIDFGFAYLTRSQLATAADAASLTAMRTLGQTQATAQGLAQSVFDSNAILASTMYSVKPKANFAFTKDGLNEPVVTVTATATINTFFLRYFGFSTLTVSSISQATRPPVILSLVLDRSGSMTTNQGAAIMPGAANSFVSNFIEGTDYIAQVSFATAASKDVGLTTTFKSPIALALGKTKLLFGGHTFALGGLQFGETQVSAPIAPVIPRAVKVAVFFTDGWANTNTDALTCSKAPATQTWAYGGQDQVGAAPTLFKADGTGGDNAFKTTCNPISFPTQGPPPSTAAFTQPNITLEAENRAIAQATKMRIAGITVFSIGLGTTADVDRPFLQTLANDPANKATFHSDQPQGRAEFADAATDLEPAFQAVAAMILERVTQ